MNERDLQLAAFYQKHRIEDQLRYYRGRREQFDRAAGQALAVSATLLGFSSAVSALAGVEGAWTALWSALATLLPAVSTALSAFTGLYAFEQQSKIFADAVRAVHAASRPTREESITERVQRVELAFRQEQAQWGQLTTQIQVADHTKD